MRRFVRLLIIGCCLAGGSVSQAQVITPPQARKHFSVTPYLGFLIFEEQEFENSTLFGLRLGFDVTPRYSLELGGAFANTSFAFAETDLPDERTEDVRFFQYFGDFYYNYPASPSVVPFGSVGVGSILHDQKSHRVNASVYFSFGGGLKFFMRPDRVIRVEIRQYTPDVELSFFNPRTGNILVSPSGAPRANIQKALVLSLGFSTYF